MNLEVIMKYKNFIFDLDGTLLDTVTDLQNSINYALSLYGYGKKSYDEVRSFLGNGIRRLVELSVPNGVDNKNFDHILQEFMAYYNNHLIDCTLPYENIIAMLDILKKNKCKIAIVSNKADAFVKNLVNTFFRGCVDISIGQNEKIRQKPHSDMVEYALRNLNIAKNDSVYLGDSEVDIETAKNSGLDCICVSWGFRSREQLLNSGAKIIVDSPLQIPNYMEVNND